MKPKSYPPTTYPTMPTSIPVRSPSNPQPLNAPPTVGRLPTPTLPTVPAGPHPLGPGTRRIPSGPPADRPIPPAKPTRLPYSRVIAFLALVGSAIALHAEANPTVPRTQQAAAQAAPADNPEQLIRELRANIASGRRELKVTLRVERALAKAGEANTRLQIEQLRLQILRREDAARLTAAHAKR